jgi:hypothetical protein
MHNVFEAICRVGDDEDYVPRDVSEIEPTEAPVGSRRKVEVMASRVLHGLPVFSPDDRVDYGEEDGQRLPPRRRKKRYV